MLIFFIFWQFFFFFFSFWWGFLVWFKRVSSAMGRSPCCDKATVKRGTWSPEEDDVLRNYVEKHGRVGNWISLPRKAGLKRCGKSCRLRWLNYLRPEIKRGNFTEKEESLIFSLYNEIGSRWSAIASHLPGRTDNDVKNLWNTKLKKRLPNRETTSINFGKTSPSKADQIYDHGSSSSPQFMRSSNFGDKNDRHGLINSSQISESKPMIVSDLPGFSSSVEAASSFSTTSSPVPQHQILAPWSINEGDEEEDELLLSWLFQPL